MKVYSLLGFVDYEGDSLLGVFGSLEDVRSFVERERESYGLGWRSESLGYSKLGYVVSELGSSVDVLRDVVYL